MRIALMPVDPAVCIYRLNKRSTRARSTSLYAVVDSDIMLAISMGGEAESARCSHHRRWHRCQRK